MVSTKQHISKKDHLFGIHQYFDELGRICPLIIFDDCWHLPPMPRKHYNVAVRSSQWGQRFFEVEFQFQFLYSYAFFYKISYPRIIFREISSCRFVTCAWHQETKLRMDDSCFHVFLLCFVLPEIEFLILIKIYKKRCYSINLNSWKLDL